MSDIPTILHNVRRCLSYSIWEVLVMLPTFVLFYYVARASLEGSLKSFFNKYAYGCFACIYACISYVCLVLEEARRGHWIPLELLMVVRCHGSGGNWTWVLWTGSKDPLILLALPLQCCGFTRMCHQLRLKQHVINSRIHIYTCN